MDKSEELVIKYLGEIPIKFAEWCINNEYKKCARTDKFIWWNPNTPTNYTTEELFKLFIEEEFSKQ